MLKFFSAVAQDFAGFNRASTLARMLQSVKVSLDTRDSCGIDSAHLKQCVEGCTRDVPNTRDDLGEGSITLILYSTSR